MSKIRIGIRQTPGILILLLLTICSCKDPVEGCLDIEAENYDVSADDPCPDDCCTYPTISLSIAHRFDTLRFSFDSTYVMEGNVGRFEQSIFYLSDFKLLTFGNTDSLETFETIDLDLINGGVTETFKDDYTLVSRSISSFAYDVADIKGEGNFTTLKFSVGLAGNEALSNAETVTEGHPLALTTDTLWTISDGYTFNRVTIIPDTMDMDVVRKFDIKELQEITLAFPLSLDLGFDVEIPLKIDYKEWFSGIDFVNQTDSEIVNLIVENTANAFSIDE